VNEIMKQVEELVYKNDYDAFVALMDSLESVDIQDKYGWTPLHLAIRRGREDMVHYLVEKKKADINIQDNSGWTPLVEAIMDDYPALVKYLVEKKTDLQIANNKGATAPMLAKKFNREAMYGYLV